MTEKSAPESLDAADDVDVEDSRPLLLFGEDNRFDSVFAIAEALVVAVVVVAGGVGVGVVAGVVVAVSVIAAVVVINSASVAFDFTLASDFWGCGGIGVCTELVSEDQWLDLALLNATGSSGR